MPSNYPSYCEIFIKIFPSQSGSRELHGNLLEVFI